MNRKSLLAVLAFVAFLGVWALINLRNVNKSVSFDDVTVDDPTKIENVVSGYITLPSITASDENIRSLIGSIAVKQRGKDTGWELNPRYRPPKSKVSSQILDETLYSGIVKANADIGGKVKPIEGSIATEDLAEVTVKNILSTGYSDPVDIPYSELEKIKISPDEEQFFIERVIVTDVTRRRFAKQNSKSNITGLAFSANGEIYSSKENIMSQKFVSFRPIPIIKLKEQEAGGGTSYSQLLAKSRTSRLSSEESRSLVDQLFLSSKDNLPSFADIKPPNDTPRVLADFEVKYYISDLIPQKQSSQNRCWAAALSMLKSWRTGRDVSEKEAVTSLGYSWLEIYNQNSALPYDFKDDLLTAAGLSFQAPQSYSYELVEELLKEHGPLWFTINKDFGSHATVLTGLFYDSNNSEYWVSYADPIDGTIKADDYASFMRRYEAPAYRSNERSLEPAYSLEDLEIQVSHWP